MKKKVVYLTQWVAKDRTKEYPHGYGFIAPVVEFPMDMDAAECVEACRELSNDEFECIGATPIPFIDVAFEILGLTPQDEIDVTYPMSIVYWNNARNMSQEEFTKWLIGSTEPPAKAVEAMPDTNELKLNILIDKGMGKLFSYLKGR
jgi:hypothetical protein